MFVKNIVEWSDIPLGKIDHNYITNGKKYINTILSLGIDEFRLRCLSLCDLQVLQCSTGFQFPQEARNLIDG